MTELNEQSSSTNKKAISGLVFFLLAMAGLIFLPAWTVDYWQAWVFLGVFGTTVLVITLYLMKNDPELLERRVKAGPGAEKEKNQKIIQFVAQIAFIAVFVVSALDFRWGWSILSTKIVLIGDFLVVLGLYIVFLVFKENSFTSAIIEVNKSQKVISSGPYAIVRHPMYAGAFIMLIGVPLALGSGWGLLVVIPLMLSIVVRLLEEEKYLIKNLKGYVEYRKRVQYRLIPFVW